MLDALIIAPHPDDAEISMGGAILRMQSDGMQVGVLDLTDGEPTPHGDVATRQRETAAATDSLQLKWRENLGLANRRLEPTLEARAMLANVFRRARPKWLFAPFPEDAHPDHVAATQLVEDARFWSKLTKCELEGEPFHPQRIFFYYSVHLRLAVKPDFVLDISEEWPKKLEALHCYQSQLIAGRENKSPSVLERIETHCAYFGHLIGTSYGEPFACREPVGVRSMQQIC